MLEEVTEAKIPFLGDEVDLMSVSAVFTLLALVFGFALWHIADAVGSNLAQKGLTYLGQYLPGGNPATASNDSDGPAFGGA